MATRAVPFPIPEAPPLVSVNVQDPGVGLARKTVCIEVRLSTMGNTRKVSTSQIEADADKDLLRVSKHLLDSAELKAVGRFDGESRRFLYNSLPAVRDRHPPAAGRRRARSSGKAARGRGASGEDEG